MDISTFLATLEQAAPDTSWSNALQALWYDANDDWDKAHEMVQDNSPASCHVHAYLHRKEGDPDNARYWYQRAGQPVAEGEFRDEWMAIVQRLR